jgi:prepilin-type N-terminal cleavage/methylation domain-containing protein
MKKNNKGFSLVELIVVVLIMGILAVALTPQVMKWVDKSRIAADKDTIQAVKTAAALAFTSKDVYDKGAVTITFKNSDLTTSCTVASGSDFKNVFKNYAGGEIESFKLRKKYGSDVKLEYTTTGVLTATIPADLSNEISE